MKKYFKQNMFDRKLFSRKKNIKSLYLYQKILNLRDCNL